jgi:hypothetical protein
MKILFAIKSGFSRSLRSWKGILVFWILSFVTVSLLVLPLKAGLNAAFGSSMITEKLIKGINFDVLGDLGRNLRSMGSSLLSGTILLCIVAILTNTFIAGGLFESVRSGDDRLTTENFFRACGKNFRLFLVVSLILSLIIVMLIVLVIVVPVSVAANAESAPEGAIFRTLALSCPVFIVAASIIMLVADYARAWQAARVQNAGFKALGFGFSKTFSTFFTSLVLMILLLIIQTLPGLAMVAIITGYTPSTGGGVFLLFVLSQLIIISRIFLKVVRYSSVTALMEYNSPQGLPSSGNPENPPAELHQNLQLDFNNEYHE